MSATPVPPEQRSPNRLYVGLSYHEQAVANAERYERLRILTAIRRWRDNLPGHLTVHRAVVNDLIEHLELHT